MIHTGGAVPGGSHVPFHIGIVDKHLSITIEGKVAGVAVAHVDHFPVGPVGIEADDPSAGCLSVTIMTIGVVLQKNIVFLVGGDAGSLKGWVAGVIAGYKVEACTIFGNDEGVRTMFPPATQGK